MGKAFTKPKLLLVEGQDEVKLFEPLLDDLDLADSFELRSVGGIAKFRKNLVALPQISGFIDNVISIGIVRDADRNPKGAFASI